MSPAEQHAHDAQRFAALTETASADDWSRPAPVEGWTARDVVRHLVEWLPGFVSRAGVELTPVPVSEDPVAAWRARADEVQRVLEEQGDVVYASPMLGEMPLAVAINQFYTTDIWMHSWDLARALGADFDLGEERSAQTLAGMQPMDAVLRSSGQFGPAVPVPDDASAQERFVGFIGRDPAWHAAS
ncbi:TIGR03086 family protein [Nocardioides terrae]|uniref:TIGR03086 family protein n=1 Tax=Nocardioides terrae TaxID=574651 RepID=A0A1I1HLR5_9ACTN|nr:TIGR03086 family metal-binding protein [Nocardioides terrae]SFC22020.1 TIGR03086 family protein [Nocardioides terrae]